MDAFPFRPTSRFRNHPLLWFVSAHSEDETARGSFSPAFFPSPAPGDGVFGHIFFFGILIQSFALLFSPDVHTFPLSHP